MTAARFTGERLHEGEAHFAVDLARHRAAYEFARSYASGGRVLDLGCGAGHGLRAIAADATCAVGIDRVRPDAAARDGAARFCRAALEALPLDAGHFDLVLSFQVIEHLEDPDAHVARLAELVAPGGVVLVTTPNRLTSDGVNPYHVHEYEAPELAAQLGRRFADVEIRGIGASAHVRRDFETRSRRIRAILRLDPLRLRERLPRRLVLRLFALGALLVRALPGRPSQAGSATWRDFPIEAARDDALDWVAICRDPRTSDFS